MSEQKYLLTSMSLYVFKCHEKAKVATNFSEIATATKQRKCANIDYVT